LIPGKAVEAVAYCNVDGLPEYSVFLLGVGNYLRVAAASQWSILKLKDHACMLFRLNCFSKQVHKKKKQCCGSDIIQYFFLPDPALTLISDPDCL
jgi:hypothetical protein